MAGEFDLSSRITADASGLVAGASEGVGALDQVTAATKRSNDATKAGEAGDRALVSRQTEIMRSATARAAATTSKATADTRSAKAAISAAAAEARLATAENNAERSAAAAALAALKLQQAQERLNTSTKGATVNVNAQGYAVRNIGQQFGDFGLQVAGGADVARAFGQQAGQLGYALSELRTGPLAKVGAFLVGPWGIAFTIAAAFVAPLIEKLFESGSAAEDSLKKFEQAAGAADSFGTAQSLLGKVMDLTTGKIKTQNAVLIESIRLQALALGAKAKADESASRKDLASYGQNTSVGGISVGNGLVGGIATALGVGSTDSSPELLQLSKAFQSGQIGIKGAVDQLSALDKAGKLAGRSLDDLQLSFLKFGTAKNDQKAAKEITDALDGKGVSGDLKPYERAKGAGRTARAPKAPNTTARDEFGRDAADKLANIRDGLDGTPAAVKQTNAQLRQLDDLIDDLARRKPPGFDKLIADARSLKPLVEDNLTKPFREYIEQQQESLDVQRLLTNGKTDEANALKVVQGLQKQMGPLSDEQKASVLGTVQAMRAEQRELDILREKNAKYVTALGSIKTTVEDATQAFVRGDLGQFIKTPGKLLNAFQTLKGQQLFDSIFGDVFRDLEDQVNGVEPVKKAAADMGAAVDQVAGKVRTTGDAITAFKPPIDDATTALGTFTSALGNAASAVSGGGAAGGSSLSAAVQSLADKAFGDVNTSSFTPNSQAGQPGDIVVTASRFSRNPEAFFADALGKIGTKVAGAFTNPDTARKIGGALGQYAGKAIGGAATGSAAAGLANPLIKALGLKTSGTGAAIGGALGSIAGPLGSALGGIAGSIIGGLFKTTKTGSATLGAVNGQAGVTGTSGNNAGLKASSSAAGGAVADSINSIISQLGGSLGSFAVSIGQKNGKYVVDNSGKGSTKYGKANDGITAYATLEEAQAAALKNAIADGAVAGLSAAVNRALQSSSDTTKAVSEALGVKNLETLLGGLSGSLKSIFDAEDAAGKERVRLAKTYGLDITQVEALNDKQRADLVDSTLKTRIGSLSDFLDSLKFGDLAEGSAPEKLAALQTQIDSVSKDAEAGVDGAADKLATLLAQKVSLARDSYGTAGDVYTGARTDAMTEVEKIIALETNRVNTAAGITTAADTQATTAAVQTVASGVNETNDLIARQTAAIVSLPNALASVIADKTNTANSKATVRNVSLQ